MDASEATPDPVTLQALIRERKEAQRLTYDAMIERAAEAGFPIARSTLHFIALKEWKNIPDTTTIMAIAHAIGAEPDEVLTAAAASVGIATRFVQFDHGTRAVIGLVQGRTPDEKRTLEDVLRSVTRAMDASANPTKE